mgnify:FL=1
MILDAYLQDPDTEVLIDDAALADAMLAVEGILARGQGSLGIIPKPAADHIEKIAATMTADIPGLMEGTIRDGVPIIALLAQLRHAVGPEFGGFVHWGATSQDIVDTAISLLLQRVRSHFLGRLDSLIDTWMVLAEDHRRTIMAARTRYQQAVPTTFGLKVAGWIAPLQRHRQRLLDQPMLLQLGGAGGTLSAMGRQELKRGPEVVAALAIALNLDAPPMPWHSQRDTIIEFAHCLAMVSGDLGKVAGDILMLAQSEFGEVQIAGAGGSSAMPQKANPVRAEAVLALARHNGGLMANMHQTAPHLLERDGVAWNLEWLTLPQMIRATGAGLIHSLHIAENLIVNCDRMMENIAASKGMLLAEAAVYALAQHMPKREAQILVKDACRDAIADGQDLFAVLQQRTDAQLDWQALADPARYLGASDDFIDAVLKRS